MAEFFDADRLQRLADLRARGVDPYPARSPEDREPAGALVREAREMEAGSEGREAVVCGRVLGRRGYGKLVFLDLHDQDGRIQACLQKDRLSAPDFALTKLLNLGDLVAVRGSLGRTRVGEPTVFGTEFRILAKALLPPPEKWHGLNDPELRARLRYADLFSSPEVRQRFLKRAAVVRALQEVLEARGFVGVETPVLHPVYGGANARPFRTHHHALDMDLYLRIAPELYLKRLLVGGLERVYEIARVFRNEGISNRHNPEFTMLEFYAAWCDYRHMAELTEELVAAAARAAGLEQEDGRLRARFRGEDYDLSPPYPRRRYRELFEEALGFPPEDRKRVRRALEEHGLPWEGEEPYPYWKAVNALFEEAVEPGLRGPVFVLDYPAAICPLAKPSPEDPAWAERFEFFLGGMELANAFSELNDPELQLRRFEEQVRDRDPETPAEVDHDYVRALAYGMPPAGGCGIGVDRLAMVLLGADSIREVLWFPHLRPEAGLGAGAEPPPGDGGTGASPGGGAAAAGEAAAPDSAADGC